MHRRAGGSVPVAVLVASHAALDEHDHLEGVVGRRGQRGFQARSLPLLAPGGEDGGLHTSIILLFTFSCIILTCCSYSHESYFTLICYFM